MSWPDPNCRASHNLGDTYRAWQHTTACKESATAKMKKTRRITEVGKTAADGVVGRARESGGI